MVPLPLTLLITAAELWSTHREALAAANSAYDRSIRGALKAIEANISTASGGLAVELPYRLFELLELTATGHVYFRVASRDGLVEVGNLDLPVPEGRLLQPGVPVFADADYLGERVRMGALLTHVRLQGDAGPVTPVVIQVAEQALSREQSAAQFVRTSLVRAIVVLLALIGIVVGSCPGCCGPSGGWRPRCGSATRPMFRRWTRPICLGMCSRWCRRSTPRWHAGRLWPTSNASFWTMPRISCARR